LAGVVFEVAHFFGTGTTGDRLRNPLDGSFEFVTNAAGIVRIGALEPGTFLITETRPLPGYINAEPVVFTVESGAVDTTITIRNYKMPTYIIRKISGDTNQPLPGVVFEIAHYFGNGNSGERIRNPIDGSFEFVTDAAGLIYIPSLPNGTFAAIETRALPGYTLADPVVFVVGDNQNTTITIRNYKQPSVVIRKICGDTSRPYTNKGLCKSVDLRYIHFQFFYRFLPNSLCLLCEDIEKRFIILWVRIQPVKIF
jgi:uncharacterized surface anchored protein